MISKTESLESQKKTGSCTNIVKGLLEKTIFYTCGKVISNYFENNFVEKSKYEKKKKKNDKDMQAKNKPLVKIKQMRLFQK